MEFWHEFDINICCGSICYAFFFPFFGYKIKILDGIALNFGCIIINYSIMAIDSHIFIIVQNRKCDYFTIKVFFAFCKLEKLNNTLYRYVHTMGILFVYDIYIFNPTFCSTSKKQKIYFPYS